MHRSKTACWRRTSTGASARRPMEVVAGSSTTQSYSHECTNTPVVSRLSSHRFELTDRGEFLARVPPVHDVELSYYSPARRIRGTRVEFLGTIIRYDVFLQGKLLEARCRPGSDRYPRTEIRSQFGTNRASSTTIVRSVTGYR
jgi:hypothetical protein